MTITTDFQTRFPELSTTIDDNPEVLNYWSAYDARTYDATNAANKEGILNLVAHLLVVLTSGDAGAAREITSQTIGRVSATYSATEGLNAYGQFFASTKYGQQYWLLLGLGGRACAV